MSQQMTSLRMAYQLCINQLISRYDRLNWELDYVFPTTKANFLKGSNISRLQVNSWGPKPSPSIQINIRTKRLFIERMHIPTILQAIDMYLPWKLNNHLKSRQNICINQSFCKHTLDTYRAFDLLYIFHNFSETETSPVLQFGTESTSIQSYESAEHEDSFPFSHPIKLLSFTSPLLIILPSVC